MSERAMQMLRLMAGFRGTGEKMLLPHATLTSDALFATHAYRKQEAQEEERELIDRVMREKRGTACEDHLRTKVSAGTTGRWCPRRTKGSLN